MYTALLQVIIYQLAKYEKDPIKNGREIAERRKWERNKIKIIKKKLELNLSGNPTGRSPSSTEKKFLICVEVQVIRKISRAMCLIIEIGRDWLFKNRITKVTLDFFLHLINLFIHSYSILHNRDQLQDHYIINCKTLDIKNNNQIGGIFIKN